MRNEGDEARWLQFRADVPGGTNVTVSPPRAMLEPGESLPLDVRFDAPAHLPEGVDAHDYPALLLVSHDTRDLLGFAFNDSGAILATTVLTVFRAPTAQTLPGDASPPGEGATEGEAREDVAAPEGDPADATGVDAAGAPAPAPPGARERLDALLRDPRAALAAAALVAGTLAAVLLAARPASRARWAWLLGTPLAALATRFRKHDLLRHPTRAALHAAIQAQPGVTLTELRHATGVRVTTLVHHLRLMERAGLVTSRRDGAHRRFALPGAGSALSPAPGPADLSPPEREVLRLLAERRRTQLELAAALGVTKQAVNRHVKSLERRGLVAATQADGRWTYGPTGGRDP